MLTYAIPRVPALPNARNPHRTTWFSNLWFKIIRLSKVRRTMSVTLSSYSILSRTDVALAFIIQNNPITWSIRTPYSIVAISPLLSSLKVGELSNMLNFAPLPLRLDAVQILFLVKNATVEGWIPVKRLQYDDVCDGQLIYNAPQ